MTESEHRESTPPRRVGVWRIVVACVLIGLTVGWLSRSAFISTPTSPPPQTQPAGGDEADKPTLYVCSMNISYHPYFSSTDPETPCGYCGMQLIPAAEDEAAGGDPTLTVISETAQKLMQIETSPVESRFPTADVDMLGKIDFDQTTLKYITAWVPGRLDRMFVDTTGVPVRQGDHMVELYSPELLSAQTELLEAIRASAELADSSVDIVRDRTEATIGIARDRLKLWGLTDEQVAEIERRGQASDRMTIYAPSGGIVIDKGAEQGMYVKVGSRLYTIADLSRLWVILDAYESDLMWLRYGQQVTFTSVATPGETFDGTISLIAPVLDARTRTVKIRVNVDNSDGKLKPGMFVKASVRATVAASGRVMAESLAGKYICPMHPSVIADSPGVCPICGMDLVTTESMGYETPTPGATPLVIPATAVLWTGKRAVVYVQVADKDKPTFQWRVVELGARAGDVYIIAQGLAEGERVVTRGAFAIDSERQLKAKPSMMNSGGATVPVDKPPTHHHGAAPKADLAEPPAQLFDAYFQVQQALATDSVDGALEAAAAMKEAATDRSDETWNEHVAKVRDILDRIATTHDIATMRREFEPLSETMLAMARRFGPPGKTIYLLHCPMAFDNRGADWLQPNDQTLNPYFGSAMPRCGSVKETLPIGDGEDAAHE